MLAQWIWQQTSCLDVHGTGKSKGFWTSFVKASSDRSVVLLRWSCEGYGVRCTTTLRYIDSFLVPEFLVDVRRLTVVLRDINSSEGVCNSI